MNKLMPRAAMVAAVLLAGCWLWPAAGPAWAKDAGPPITERREQPRPGVRVQPKAMMKAKTITSPFESITANDAYRVVPTGPWIVRVFWRFCQGGVPGPAPHQFQLTLLKKSDRSFSMNIASSGNRRSEGPCVYNNQWQVPGGVSLPAGNDYVIRIKYTPTGETSHSNEFAIRME